MVTELTKIFSGTCKFSARFNCTYKVFSKYMYSVLGLSIMLVECDMSAKPNMETCFSK